MPDRPLVSFGLAGSLVPGLEVGALVCASRVVDEQGRLLWAGEPLAVPGARSVVVCGASRLVDDPRERAAIARETGAEAVDMESGVLASTGRLVGVVRAISDVPGDRIGRLALAAGPDGGVDWPALLRAFALEPAGSVRGVRRARQAFHALECAARELATRLGSA